MSLDASRCPLCQRPNHCQLCTNTAYKGPCWCMRLTIPDELLAQVPADLRNKACICRECVVAFSTGPTENIQHSTFNIQRSSEPDDCAGSEQLDVECSKLNVECSQVQPGEFYFEANGLMVFTAAYHLRRGYCCGSGCRHCPYPAA